MPRTSLAFAVFIAVVAIGVFIVTFGHALRNGEPGMGTFGDAFGVAAA